MNQTVQTNHSRVGWLKRIPGKSWISILLLILLLIVTSSQTFWKWMYPIEYYNEITTVAKEMHADPLLVAAIIRTESKFDEHDVSHAGAVGLMQLMPKTADWIAKQAGFSDYHVQSLAQREVNIRLGSWYINYLVKMFKGNEYAAIAAYNSGPNRVKEWLQSGRWDGTLAGLDHVPVGETRHFVQRVTYNYNIYKKIYK
ncbi:lytic transglycosylase domain-containing protein [Fodinisporobacter ferrooxydans]|uniref:Lytic transglycosylase domain-containing protein n=1 Tax=Fodinisporobacter ferrooxydans TaxID=2901836 RepID=A0ABY4CQ99_9BACL|nr:lytic transglycosylase domain-containing protein [Alicyclobacillaceae bacterium MYW30-H2]